MSTLQTANLKNASSGSNNIVLATDGSTTITTLNSTTITGTSVRGVITSGTAVASTSGTSIDFTGIPSWVKRVTVMFSGVSTNGSSPIVIRFGTSSGFIATGYISSVGRMDSTPSIGSESNTTGFIVVGASNTSASVNGNLISTNITGNTWTVSSVVNYLAGANTSYGGGSVALSGTLDRIRITTVNGTDTFDAGSINILYEG